MHVWSEPFDVAEIGDERRCTEPDMGQEIIFHVRSVVLSSGHIACLDCPESTDSDTFTHPELAS